MVAISKIATTALAIGAASAHTIFQELWVNGVAQGHVVGIRVPTYDGPINDVTSNDIICNGGPNPLNTPYSSTVINVPSGASITLEWHHTLDGANPSDSADPVDPGHKGPIMAYLAAVPSALQTSVTGLKWFKVYEDGWDPATNVWAVDKLVANKGKVTFKLPDCIPSGNYFLRGELLALHGASSTLGAQFYMECAQINIVGGGTASPPTLLSSDYDVQDPRPATIHLPWQDQSYNPHLEDDAGNLDCYEIEHDYHSVDYETNHNDFCNDLYDELYNEDHHSSHDDLNWRCFWCVRAVRWDWLDRASRLLKVNAGAKPATAIQTRPSPKASTTLESYTKPY
ncbi:hypothetical protein DRE_01201 [Drechslerella stenobrocha 248]|uniref:AA9 family lytic polysaccharide monooxygenase n=1 Tax=Drechslerella stenobrocha 248 TaxID=1043628 RepID=W7I6F6_9PEZI|nr:hypothetical protein DRE_01201 [Drechslerella stenobrocha 248]